MNIDESLTAKGYTPADKVLQVFGTPRRVESITIHHWGVFGQTHDGVNNFFVNGPGTTSAHFNASAGRVNCLVSPADAAWAAGNAYGNATSIHIECRPEASDDDYQTVAELVAKLRSEHGDLPLIPHRDWQATACPGIWDLVRLDKLARHGSINAQAGTITPKPVEKDPDDMPLILAKQPGKNRPDVWIGNVITRRRIPNDQTLKDIIHLHNTGVAPLHKNGEIMEYENLDAIGQAI